MFWVEVDDRDMIEGETEYVFTMYNDKGLRIALPASGPGRLLIYLIGGILLVAAAGAIVVRYRKEKEQK